MCKWNDIAYTHRQPEMTDNGKGEKQRYEKVPTREIIKENEAEEIPKYGFGVRHVQCLIMFLSLALGYIARGHLGVTIVAMTHVSSNAALNLTHGYEDHSVVNKTNASVYSDAVNNTAPNGIDDGNETGMTAGERNDTWNVYRTYDWPKSTQEMVLGSFFLGYSILMFPMGLVCQRWGGKLPLQIALSVNGAVSIFTPWLTSWGGWKATCACRFVQGLSQAGIYPALHTLLAKWVPLEERGSLSSCVYTGTTFGTVLAFQVSGVLADSSWGWPSVFWATGGVCIIIFVLLTYFGAASPAQHKSVSGAEKNFILGKVDDGVTKKLKTPWKAILMSKPVWAAMIAHAGSGMSFVFVFTQVPTYLHHILGVNVRSSGLLSSLPYIACFVTTIGFGALSDYCTNRRILSVKAARIICNTIAQTGPAACLAAVSFTQSTALAVTSLILSMATHGGVHTGWMVNYMDLAPNYSGAVMAIGNTLTNFCCLLLPVLVSNILLDVTNVFQWRIIFLSMAAVAFISNAVFTVFMSADVQPWNDNACDADEVRGNIKKA